MAQFEWNMVRHQLRDQVIDLHWPAFARHVGGDRRERIYAAAEHGSRDLDGRLDNRRMTRPIALPPDVAALERQIELINRFPDQNPNPVMRMTNDGLLIYANASSEPDFSET